MSKALVALKRRAAKCEADEKILEEFIAYAGDYPIKTIRGNDGRWRKRGVVGSFMACYPNGFIDYALSVRCVFRGNDYIRTTRIEKSVFTVGKGSSGEVLAEVSVEVKG